MAGVTPRELTVAARVADGLVYACGLAGVVAGGLLFREGQTSWAVIAWTLTFVAGAGLRLAAAVTRAIAEVLARQTAIEQELRTLRGGDLDQGQRHVPGQAPQPRRSPWSGWH